LTGEVPNVKAAGPLGMARSGELRFKANSARDALGLRIGDEDLLDRSHELI